MTAEHLANFFHNFGTKNIVVQHFCVSTRSMDLDYGEMFRRRFNLSAGITTSNCNYLDIVLQKLDEAVHHVIPEDRLVGQDPHHCA